MFACRVETQDICSNVGKVPISDCNGVNGSIFFSFYVPLQTAERGEGFTRTKTMHSGGLQSGGGEVQELHQEVWRQSGGRCWSWVEQEGPGLAQ